MFNRDKKQVNVIEKTILKPSRFNVLLKKNNEIKIFNSYTGEIIKFSNETTQKVLDILRKKEIKLEKNNELIDFLSNRGIVVRSTTDEFRKATSQKVNLLSQDRTLNLIVMPNEDCNFRCIYCYEDFQKKEMKSFVKNGIINFLKENLSEFNTLSISWFGGEPLESFDIIQELSEKIIDLCCEFNVDYLAGITTNGYNLTEERFKKLIDLNVYSYQITLDGNSQTHDKLRKRKDGAPTFDKIIGNLLNIKRSNVECSILLRSNVSQDVSEVMFDYIDLIRDLFQDDSRFLMHFVPVLNLKGEQSGNIHLCNTRDLFPFYKYAKEKGFNFDFYKDVLQPGGSECYASNPNSYVIGSDGMVYKCTVAFNNPLNHVGDIKENGELELYEERLSLWLSGGANEDPNCTKCYFRPACQGNACPLERIEADKTPCPPIKQNLKRYLDLVEEDLIYG
ncbi:radical SAM/SPASM domain-containing protein [Bacillus haynesii]|uniref:radical SAM/SPASM domain-containing protein n=1 Tax=Bacillus haynesii TaxID=1925021 RepID=UPI002DB9B0F0|nr:radical SAM protein [Bacillus haynesii]MEC1560508.1 radical SAM protein [Bacillus haynesii]